ncbi:MAG TPA: hypothetical protein VGI89_09795 [Rhizomicrobium sp.]|jgi:hypothetical protein
MQINAAALLASQQVSQAQAKPQPGFAAALEKTGGFEPLPLKQVMHTDESPATPVPAAVPARLGATLDIKI